MFARSFACPFDYSPAPSPVHKYVTPSRRLGSVIERSTDWSTLANMRRHSSPNTAWTMLRNWHRPSSFVSVCLAATASAAGLSTSSSSSTAMTSCRDALWVEQKEEKRQRSPPNPTGFRALAQAMSLRSPAYCPGLLRSSHHQILHRFHPPYHCVHLPASSSRGTSHPAVENGALPTTSRYVTPVAYQVTSRDSAIAMSHRTAAASFLVRIRPRTLRPPRPAKTVRVPKETATREWNLWYSLGPSLDDAPCFSQMASVQYACHVCQMEFNGPVTYKGHLESAGHQKKVAVQKQLEMLSTGGATLRPTREAAQPLPLPTVAARTPPTLQVSQPPEKQLEKKSEQKDEVIDLSCRFCGIVLFEDVVSKLQHLETEGHRKKKGLPL
ncbi:hypothetical protein HPB50_027749 [Hyalomma asiaticum]|nr:hypothetical protein HPB50_027749 [Hyalomma asiaticum]